MKIFLNNIAIALLALCLISCDNAKNNTTPDKGDKEVVTENSITSTSQLIAPKNMKFISHKNINLAVDIENQGGGPAYLSVYVNYKQNGNNSWEVNHDSRILASSMTSSLMSHNFATPQHIQKLLVQIWFYDGREPLSEEVEIKNQINLIW